MIKKIDMAICDICGAMDFAKRIVGQYNSIDYDVPDGWTHGKNQFLCICPACTAKLNGGAVNDGKRAV